MLNVKIKKLRDVQLPTYATVGSAAMDFRACGDYEILPGKRQLVPLGIAMSIPSGYELRLSPRSGLALKQGITLTNSPGLIDSDYRGEIGAIVHNLGDDIFVVKSGDKICQGGFYEYKKVSFDEVEELDETDRGTGGYGSTGT